MSSPFLNHLKRSFLRLLQPNAAGFTLIEVLIAAAIGSIMISSLLWLMVNLLGTERRESALSETERDMKRALGYMTSELKQAVYIYDGSYSTVGTSTQVYAPYFHTDPDTAAYRFLPSWVEEINDTNPDTVPVLAFWKTDPADEAELGTVNCNDSIYTYSGIASAECTSLKRRRFTYSLVVYTQDTVPDDDATWSGRTTIQRLEVAKYRDEDSDGKYYDDFAKNRVPGFVDPADAGVGIFPTWPYILSGTTECNLQTSCADVDGSLANTFFPAGVKSAVSGTYSKRDVLTDFVDEYLPDDLANPTCPSADYRLTTLNTAGSTVLSRSFYACVRSVDNVSSNQDVILFLRGNAYGRSGLETDLTTAVLQTRVALRGVIDKKP